MSESPVKHLDREEVAKREIGHTVISRWMCVTLVVFFLATILIVPLVQQSREAVRGETPQALSIFLSLPEAAQAFVEEDGSVLDQIFAANGVLLRAIDRYETDLEDRSFLAEYFIPRMQQVYAEWMGLGNEQAYLGRDGWLFYRPGVDYLTGPGFLEPAFQRRRTMSGDASVGKAIQPDPVKAIVDFRDQLEARGIHLIVMPVPVKGVVHPERLSARYEEASAPVQNPSYGLFIDQMDLAGVDVFDVTDRLWERRVASREEQFLETDTHWTPEAMEAAAGWLANHVREWIPDGQSLAVGQTRGQQRVSGEGDIAAMLKLPDESTLFPKQEVEIHPVRQGEAAWEPDEEASVLLLGDSFSNIYSLEEMGWGGSAGLAEQLSYLLQQPVDALLRNDAGAYATRERLAAEMGRGNDRLEGKKVVIWEFAMRELAVGDWKMISLPESSREEPVEVTPAGAFFVPPMGESVEVEATVQSRSMVPRPGTVPYKDQIFSVHLVGVTGENVPEGSQAMVYLFGMIDNQLTDASAWKVGDRVSLILKDWNEVASQYDRLNRSEPEDFELQLEPPAWGEPLEEN